MTQEKKPYNNFFGFKIPTGADGELLKQTFLSYLSGVFLLVIFLVFILPRFADVATTKAKIKEIRTSIDRITKTLDSLDNFKNNIDENTLASVDMAMPESFDPGYILLSLKKLTSNSSISLVSYTLGGGKLTGDEKIGSVVPHRVNIDIEGTPSSVISFLDALAVNMPIVTVNDLSISEVGKILASSADLIKLSMELSYYHLPAEEKPATTLEGKYLTQEDFDTIERISKYGRLDALEIGGDGLNIPLSPKENLF